MLKPLLILAVASLPISAVSLYYASERGAWHPECVPFTVCLAFAAEDSSRAKASAVVEDYWTRDAKSRYSLLSQTYKQRLRRLGIGTATQYERAIAEPERVWGKRTYQGTKLVGSSAAEVTLLIAWEQEGYQGVMTFIFDLVLENDHWMIENIVH